MAHKFDINPNRLNWCCEDAGITATDLPKKCNIVATTIAKAQAGEKALTYKQIEKLAEFFNRSWMFFMDDAPLNPATVHSPHYRTLHNQSPALSWEFKKFTQRVEQHRKIFVDLLEDADYDYFPQWHPPDIKPTDADAEHIRTWLGLTEENTFASLRDAVEQKGVMVILSAGYPGKWKIPDTDNVTGMAYNFPTMPIIVVKKQTNQERQAFTLVHELAHLLLHHETRLDDKEHLNSYEQKEQEANDLATRLLSPAQFTHTTPKKTGNGTRKRFAEPIDIFGRFYVGTVLEAWQTDQISCIKASNYLDNLKIRDLQKLLTHPLSAPPK